jgi:hypothetical protein
MQENCFVVGGFINYVMLVTCVGLLSVANIFKKLRFFIRESFPICGFWVFKNMK